MSEEMISFKTAINVVDEGENYTVNVDLPGFNKESIKVNFVKENVSAAGF